MRNPVAPALPHGPKEVHAMEADHDSNELVQDAADDCGLVHIHEHHQSVLNRLARIEGHVRGIRRMVQEGKPCPDLLIQVAAVRSALNGVGRIILQDHIRGCMLDAVNKGDFESAYDELEQSLGRLIS
jgi:DNA-binding FrmR family transcriptional regulator